MKNILVAIASVAMFATVAATQTTSPANPPTTTSTSIPAPTSSTTSWPANPLPMSVVQLKQQAQAGNVMAMVDLGGIYYRGLGVKCDTEEARKWYSMASAAGNGEAAMSLVQIFLAPDSERKSDEELKDLIAKAIEYCTRNAGAGQAREILLLGFIYDYGIGTGKQDRKRAAELFKQSAELGNYWAMKQLFNTYAYGHCGDVDMKEAEIWRAKGIAACKKAFDAGNTRALDILLYFYEASGKGQNEEAAFQCAQKGAEMNMPSMMYTLANYYKSGFGVKYNPAKYVEWLTKAAECGSTDAKTSLGKLYEKGQYVERNPAKAEQFYVQATKSDVFNYFMLWRVYKRKGELEQAKKYLDLAIADCDRKIRLNWFLRNNLNQKATFLMLNKDDTQDWAGMLKQTGELGEMYSFFWLGGRHCNGQIANADVDKGAEYFERAAEKRFAPAMLELGHIYRNGKIVDQNFDLAIEWYLRAIDCGSNEGYSWLAFAYCEIKDYPAAFEAYQKGAARGDDDAMLGMGLLYLDGKGVEIDENKGMELLKESAQAGNADAMNWIGSIFELGGRKSFPQNLPLAFEWYKKSADIGDHIGLYCLARCYEKGSGTNQDLKKALELYIKADQAGDKYAAEKIDYLREQLGQDADSATSAPTTTSSPTTQPK